MDTLLILGYRKGLIEAVEKLGFEAVLWDEKPVSSKIARLCRQTIVAPFGDETSPPESIDPSLKSYSFRAVIAVKEKAVVTAAWLRQWWGIPGLSLEEALRCHDKKFMKEHALQHQLPITEFRLIDENTQTEDLVAHWNYPFVVKPRCSSGRRGLQIITEGYPPLPRQHIAERFINGDECSVESFVVDGKMAFMNVTQYYRLMHANIVPAAFPPETQAAIIDLNERVLRAFNITRGMTHVEFFQCGNSLLFGEIAIRPPGGYIMNLLEQAYGQPMWECYLHAELNLPIPVLKPQAYTASWIIHPGAGTVHHISGLEKCREDPNVVDSKIRLAVGDTISSRLGVGEDVGRILLKAPSYTSLEQSLLNIEKHLRIECS